MILIKTFGGERMWDAEGIHKLIVGTIYVNFLVWRMDIMIIWRMHVQRVVCPLNVEIAKPSFWKRRDR